MELQNRKAPEICEKSLASDSGGNGEDHNIKNCAVKEGPAHRAWGEQGSIGR